MEISFCSHPNTNKVIATIFGTWHDSWAVVACAKFCCDVIISNWIRAKWNFHHIWIVMEKSLVKWVPDFNVNVINLSAFLRQSSYMMLGMDKVSSWLTDVLAPSLRWRHNGRDSASNHQPHHCLLNRLFRRRSKKTSKLHVTGPRWIPHTNGQ